MLDKDLGFALNTSMPKSEFLIPPCTAGLQAEKENGNVAEEMRVFMWR